MNKAPIILFVSVFLGFKFSSAQSIQQLINAIDQSNLELTVAQLSGEQPAQINGISQTISSRVQNVNDLAATYIEERLAGLPNLNVQIQEFNTNGKNVIATQVGQTNPDNIFLICAHYDSVTSFCADDNATGVAAVIEIARILSTQCVENTIVYALWDEEEIGLLGANYYAQQAASTSNGNTRDNILAVINMDMIGYDGDAPGTPGDNDFDIDVRNIANSVAIKDDLLNLVTNYNLNLNPIVVNPGTTASDHSRFWNQGYSAVLVGESLETNDQTPDYHTANDRVEDIDFPYMTELTKLVGAYLFEKSQLLPIENTVTLDADSLIASDMSGSYQWFDCDSDIPISGATNRIFIPASDGNYAVEVTSGGCTERSDCINYSLLGLEPFAANEVKVYPNPAESLITIENFTNLELEIQINDISGKLVLQKNLYSERLDVPIETFPEGVYFVNISSGTKTSTYKIIKE